MKSAYLRILIGIVFIRLNFYLASVGIDLLPNMIGYLLILLGCLKLNAEHKSPFYVYANVLSAFLLLKELLNAYVISIFMRNLWIALLMTIALTLAQIFLFRCILQGSYSISQDFVLLHFRRRYTFLAGISLSIYLYLCFFGGYLFLMNLSALIETAYLLVIFFRLYQKERHIA